MNKIYRSKNWLGVSFFLLLFTGVTNFFSYGNAQTLSKNSALIVLDSEAGEQLLFGSKARRDYLPLSLDFLTQDNLAYCGVATTVMILNALKIQAPVARNYTIAGRVSYRFFTQENVFDNQQTRKVITPEAVSKRGITLAQLGEIFKSYSVKVQTIYGSDVSLEQFRKLVVQNLQQSNNFVVVNYSRQSIGQQGGGHISPIAAYNKKSDRFLILDVARYRYEPVWVSVEALWEAIKTTDSASEKTRGFLLLDASN